jgi:hypothetical protein
LHLLWLKFPAMLTRAFPRNALIALFAGVATTACGTDPSSTPEWQAGMQEAAAAFRVNMKDYPDLPLRATREGKRLVLSGGSNLGERVAYCAYMAAPDALTGHSTSATLAADPKQFAACLGEKGVPADQARQFVTDLQKRTPERECLVMEEKARAQDTAEATADTGGKLRAADHYYRTGLCQQRAGKHQAAGMAFTQASISLLAVTRAVSRELEAKCGSMFSQTWLACRTPYEADLERKNGALKKLRALVPGAASG